MKNQGSNFCLILIIFALWGTVLTGCKDSGSSYTPATGELDITFGGNGIVVDDNSAGGGGDDYGNSIFVDTNDNVYVTGYSRNSSNNYDMTIWKYKSDGTPDTSFGNNGIAVDDNVYGGGFLNMGFSIYVDENSTVYVAGATRNGSGTNDMALWKYKSDGTPDTSFGTNGYVADNNAAGGDSHDEGYSITLDSNGSIYVAGMSFGVTYDMVIWKYTNNGIPDSSFGTNGIVVDDNAAGGSGLDEAWSIAVDASGGVYLTGSSQSSSNYDMVIWKYTNNGIRDNSFGTNGIVVDDNAAGGGSHDNGYSIFLDTDGKIFVTGKSINSDGYEDMVIWKYNNNGTLDTSFGTNGIAVATGGDYNDAGKSIFVDPVGKVYVSGYSMNGADDDMAIWRYTDSGIPDISFGNNGIVTSDDAAGGGNHEYGSSIFVDNSGKVYVTGSSDNSDANRDMIIWKYK
ncbi:delta-60 repeat domain-containing protein [Spirochaetota bacterium]